LLEEVTRLKGGRFDRQISLGEPHNKSFGEQIEAELMRKKEGKVLTSSSLNLPALQIRSNSSPPEAYSMTMARCVGVRMTSLKRMMLGWRNERWLMISRCTFSSICSMQTKGDKARQGREGNN
jgi:hypothetical protein